jgi:hypothetical protein
LISGRENLQSKRKVRKDLLHKLVEEEVLADNADFPEGMPSAHRSMLALLA